MLKSSTHMDENSDSWMSDSNKILNDIMSLQRCILKRSLLCIDGIHIMLDWKLCRQLRFVSNRNKSLRIVQGNLFVFSFFRINFSINI